MVNSPLLHPVLKTSLQYVIPFFYVYV